MEKNNRFNKNHDGPGLRSIPKECGEVQEAPQEKEIRIILVSPHVIRLTVRRGETVTQVLKRLERLGLRGFSLGAQPRDFLFLPLEKIYDRIADNEIIYAFRT